MKTRVYFGGSLRAREAIRDLVSRLPEGVHSMSSWLWMDINPDRRTDQIIHGATTDLKDISQSDVFVQCFPHVASTTGGVNTELGIALGLGLHIIVFGAKNGPIASWGRRHNIFHWLEQVNFIDTQERLFDALTALRK